MATFNGLPLYEGEMLDELGGVLRVSLVDRPAVQSDFLMFNEQKPMQTFAVANEEKRLIRGVLMRADYPIYRIGTSGFEYYITFSAKTIRKVFEKYLREHRSSNVNLRHEPDSEVKGVDLTQIFFKDTAAGIAPVGFEEIEEGSAFGEYHVTNDAVWNAVKEGTFKGFSIEGYFQEVEIENNTKKNNMSMNLRKVFVLMRDVVTDKAVLLWDGDEDLKAGDDVFVEEEGERKPAPDGDYTTEDGKKIVVAGGKVAELIDPEAEVAPEEAEVEAAEEPAEETEAEPDAPAEGVSREEFDALAQQVADLQAALDKLTTANEQMREANTQLREQVEAFAKAPAADPAHEQFRETPSVDDAKLPKEVKKVAAFSKIKKF